MSSSSSFSNSSSTPVVPPEELITQDILNQIANISTGFAQQMMQWGQSVFNNASAVTSQTIPQYLQAAQQMMSGAGTAMGEFTNKYIPLNNQLTQDALSYAGAPRIAMNMGEAEAGQTQAGQAALEKTRQQLEASGVDTSSGRYADLLKSENAATNAAAAGAGNQAEISTENIGRQMRAQALQNDIQMPAIAANFANAGTQALTGGTNAALGTANTWANVAQVPNAYLSTAMQDKYPPMGQQSRSVSGSQSSNPGSQGGGNKGSNGGGNQGNGSNGGNGGGSQGNGPNGTSTSNGGRSISGPFGNGSGAKIMSGLDTGGNDFQTYAPGVDNNPWDAGNGNMYQGGYNDPFSDTYGGYNTGGQDFGSYSDPNYSSVDPYSSYNDVPSYDNSNAWDSSAGDNSGYTGWDGSGGGGSTDMSSYQDPYAGMSDTSSYDTSGSYSDYGGDGGDAGYARGGNVRPRGYANGGSARPTSGGYAPPSASPSGGSATDDIPARLNAGEYVIPRDVVHWKGHEYFQKLIAQARKARGQPAGPTPQGKPKPALAGPPRFVSKGYDDGGAIDDGSGQYTDSFQIPNSQPDTGERDNTQYPIAKVPQGMLQQGINKWKEFALQDNGFRPLTQGTPQFDMQQQKMNQMQQFQPVPQSGVLDQRDFQMRNATRAGNQEDIKPSDYLYDDQGNLISGQASPELDI